MNIFISTGEVSGDLQGGMLVSALYRQAKQRGIDLTITALGGDRMAEAGANLFSNTTTIGSVGLIESLPYVIPTIQIQQRVKKYLRANPPDLVVLIDYMGPNIGISTFVKKHLPDIPVLWYIAPQEWVWSFGEQRTNQIIQLTDQILAIFPQEAKYFAERGGNVTFVGHPLVDRVQSLPDRASARQLLGIAPNTRAIALLPASRQQEIKYLLPVMFEAAANLQQAVENVQFFIPLSLEKYRPAISQAIDQYQLNATIYPRSSQETIDSLTVFAAMDLAITKSGTVNLELGLLKIPQVVIYRVNPFTAWVVEHLLNFSIPFMSPTNLVEMRPIVPELLQYHATPTNIVREASALLTDDQRRQTMIHEYERMRLALGDGQVCDRTAQVILDVLVCRN
jgi:lipid-A-disaccharide synthase